jgi:small subunit ribosomal protein S16
MALKMRLVRMGAKKKPYYRIVVAATESPRNGKYIEIVGNYDPKKDPEEINLKEDRVKDWLSKGVVPTVTVSSLLAKKGIKAPSKATQAALAAGS